MLVSLRHSTNLLCFRELGHLHIPAVQIFLEISRSLRLRPPLAAVLTGGGCCLAILQPDAQCFFFLLKQMSISHKHTTKRFPASRAKSPRHCWESKLIVADAQGVGFPHCSGIQWGLWTSFLQPSSFYCIVINKYYLFQRNNNLKRKQRCWEKTVLKVFANESVSIILGGWLICDRILV